jgi:hypothetical protein
MKTFGLWWQSVFAFNILFFLTNLSVRLYLNWPLNQTIATPDSISYRPALAGPQTFPYEGSVSLTKLSEISFIGNSLRPWTINLIFQLFSNDVQILIFHIVFASFAWTFLFFTLFKLPLPKVNIFLSTTLLFLFSLTPFIYSWEKFILSESIVNSSFIIFVGLLINKVNYNYEPLNRIFLNLSWLFLLISRPIFALCLLPLLFININFKSFKRVLQQITICLIFLIYVFIINQNSSNKWLEYMGTPREGLTFSHFASPNFSKSQDFVTFAKLNSAPECLYNSAKQNNSPWFTARDYNFNCKSGVEWIDSNFLSSYINFLLSPKNLYNFVISNTLDVMKGVDFRIFYPFFSEKNLLFFTFLNSIFWVQSLAQLLFYVIISLFLFVNFYLKRNRFLIFILIYFLSIIGSLAQISLMPTDYGRLGLPGSIIFNLFSLLFLVNLIAHFFSKNLKAKIE